MRSAAILKGMDAADQDPEPELAGQARNLVRCKPQPCPILCAPLLERRQRFPAVAGQRALGELHQFGARRLGLAHHRLDVAQVARHVGADWNLREGDDD